MSNKNKNKTGIVFSTDPGFTFSDNTSEEMVTLPNQEQNLRLWLEKGKGGKVSTIVKGFIGSETDLQLLGKELKQLCGAGGNAKNEEIIIQGDARDKILNYLIKLNYKVKKAGG